MAVQENTWNVANRMHSNKDSDNPALNHIITGADEIYDDDKGKKQSVINAETAATLATHTSQIQGFNNQNYVTVVATSLTTDATDVLPAEGSVDTVYRVGNWDGTQYDVTCYSEYSWSNNAYQHISTKTQIGEVFDISLYKASGGTLATFADLAAALDSGNNVPVDIRRGGMSVKYVHTYDNKYVQARCMAQSFTTDVTQWQGVDKEITSGSHNLAESGSINSAFKDITKGYTNTSIFSGQSSGQYDWLEDVNIPSGCLIHNCGNVSINFYGVKDTSSQIKFRLAPNQSAITEFDIVALRDFGSAGVYTIVAYKDTWPKSLETSVINITSELNNKVSVKYGKNLFDALNGTLTVYLTSTGGIGGQNTTNITNYISVDASTDYYFSQDGDIVYTSGTGYHCFYDVNKEFISSVSKNTKQFTTPANCAYIRLTYGNGSDYTKPMLNKGTERGYYEERSVIAGYPDKNQEQIDENTTNMASLKPIVSEMDSELHPYTRMSNEELNLTSGWVSDDLVHFVNNGMNRALIAVNEGDKYYLRATNGAYSGRYAFLTSNEVPQDLTMPLVSGTVASTIPAGSTKEITIPSGCNYLTYNINGNTYRVYYYAHAINQLSERITKETERAIAAEEGLRDDIIPIPESIRAHADDLSSDLVLSSFPRSNKFGDKYTFTCLVDSFVGIKICRGYAAYKACWFEIDSTNIILKKYESSTYTKEIVAHGLTIEKVLNINVNVLNSGSAIVTIDTLGGSFSYTFTGWGYDATGELQVKNNGSSLSNCSLSADNNYFTCPIWVFGASYEGVHNAGYAKWLKSMGFFNFLLNGYPGRDCTEAISDFQRALNYGKPRFLYFAGANTTPASTYKTKIQQVVTICEENNIIPIVYYRPDIPVRDYSPYRTAIDDIGCRKVNGYVALQDPSKTWSEGTDVWYDGFLEPIPEGGTYANQLHPTELGAKALAMRFLVDFPEIMRYANEQTVGTAGNFVGFNSYGHIADSGVKPSDFEPAQQ